MERSAILAGPITASIYNLVERDEHRSQLVVRSGIRA